MLSSAFWITVVVLLVACLTPAHAELTFLLQEPYGHLGQLSPTGHAAIYFSRICADTPTMLRRCEPGETGVVISRYSRIGGYDWLAIPLIPYLYAVDHADDVPSSIDRDAVDEMRDRYRRGHLRDLVPDRADGTAPGGAWNELVGAAYNRKIYGFRISTTEAQDDLLIQELNSKPNKSRFNFFFSNCADFARAIVNGYFPGAVRRSYVADMGLMTPKQVAKSLVKYDKKHPETQLSVYLIPQVPGTMRRSKSVHGVAESLLKTKKYVLPLAFFQPFFIGGVAAAYITEGRFSPGQDAVTLASAHDLYLITGEGKPLIAAGAAAPNIELPAVLNIPPTVPRLAYVDTPEH